MTDCRIHCGWRSFHDCTLRACHDGDVSLDEGKTHLQAIYRIQGITEDFVSDSKESLKRMEERQNSLLLGSENVEGTTMTQQPRLCREPFTRLTSLKGGIVSLTYQSLALMELLSGFAERNLDIVMRATFLGLRNLSVFALTMQTLRSVYPVKGAGRGKCRLVRSLQSPKPGLIDSPLSN
jgi:hypothetical protein